MPEIIEVERRSFLAAVIFGRFRPRWFAEEILPCLQQWSEVDVSVGAYAKGDCPTVAGISRRPHYPASDHQAS